MAIQYKILMEMGQHGHVGYFTGYILMKYTDKGQMEPIAITADLEFAEAYVNGTAVWPDDGVGVVKILALPDKDIEDDD